MTTVGKWQCPCGTVNAPYSRNCTHCKKARPGGPGPAFTAGQVTFMILAALLLVGYFLGH